MEIEKSTTDKSKLILVVAVIILVGALFGAMGYLLGSKNNNSGLESQYTENQETDQNEEVTEEDTNNDKAITEEDLNDDEKTTKDVKDETADWNIYKSEEFGFEIKYPQKAEIISEKENEIRINLPIISENYVSEKYLLINLKYTDKECLNPMSTRIEKTEEVTISDTDFIKETGGGAAAGSVYYSESYSTLKNNWCLSLSFVVRSHHYSVDKNKEHAVFNQIISTLESIKSPNEITNLKAYSGNKLNKNGKPFTFNYSPKLWEVDNNGYLSHKNISSCELSLGGLFRQSMSNIIETEKMFFGNYEARKTKLGNSTDGVVRINVYFDADPSSEFSLFLPKDENDKQTCKNNFDTILSTIKFF